MAESAFSLAEVHRNSKSRSSWLGSFLLLDDFTPTVAGKLILTDRIMSAVASRHKTRYEVCSEHSGEWLQHGTMRRR